MSRGTNHGMTPPLDGKVFSPLQYYIVMLGGLSSAIMFMTRCNLSVAIVAMVSDQADQDSRLNGSSYNSSESIIAAPLGQNGTLKFHWSGAQEGIVLGSYYYGYALVQIATGLLADKFECVLLNVITHLISSILTLATPLAASYGIWSISLVRGLLGLAHAPMLSSLYSLYGNWFPINEISTPLSLMKAGCDLGIAVVMPLTAWLCDSSLFGGWPAAFYLTGLINLILPIVWYFTVTSNPNDHPWRSKKIEIHPNNRTIVPTVGAKRDIDVKWRAIFTSIPLWSIILSRTGQGFGYMFMITKIPAYFESVLKVNLRSNGFFNSLLYIFISISQAVSGPLAKYIINRGYLTQTTTRKVFETLGLLIPSLCLGCVPMMGSDSAQIMILLVLSSFFMGCVCGGHIPIISEIAPDLSGTIFGITNLFISLMGLFAPIFVGILLDYGSDVVTQWNIVFYFGAGFMVLVNLLFVTFATSEPQPWYTSKSSKHADEFESGLE